MDSFEHKGKSYEVKQKLKFGEVAVIRNSMSDLLDVQNRLDSAEKLTQGELIKLGSAMMGKSKNQDQILADTLMKNLGLNQDEINDLDYDDALHLFNQVFLASTTIKKKSEPPSTLESKLKTSDSQQ